MCSFISCFFSFFSYNQEEQEFKKYLKIYSGEGKDKNYNSEGLFIKI